MQTFTRVAKFTSIILLYAFPIVAGADWKVDFSRRSSEMGKPDAPASSEVRATDVSFVEQVFKNTMPTQDVVILNTEQGFIPNTVRVREGTQYRFVVVNINDKAKNVSFVLDAFSENHATFYGQQVSFQVVPKKEGTYTFVSPETSAQGRVVVHPALQKDTSVRSPASEGN